MGTKPKTGSVKKYENRTVNRLLTPVNWVQDPFRLRGGPWFRVVRDWNRNAIPYGISEPDTSVSQESQQPRTLRLTSATVH